MALFKAKNYKGEYEIRFVQGRKVRTVFDCITLVEQSAHKYAVVYGLHIHHGLDYAAAAAEMADCLMHYMTSQGELTDW